MIRGGRAAGVLVLAGPLVIAAACSDINNHLLEGQEYYPAGACLAQPAVIDDLPGNDPGDNCAPECILVPQDGGAVAFITTTCPPYPGYTAPEVRDAARDAADPCVGAFAVYYSDAAACVLVDGGIPEAAIEAAAADATRPDAAHGPGPEGGSDAPGDAVTSD